MFSARLSQPPNACPMSFGRHTVENNDLSSALGAKEIVVAVFLELGGVPSTVTHAVTSIAPLASPIIRNPGALAGDVHTGGQVVDEPKLGGARRS